MNDKPRLIDADALFKNNGLENCDKHGDTREGLEMIMKYEVKQMIDDAPTVDAVPVVRCKDCKLHENCSVEDIFKMTGLSADRTFCAAGKKIDEEEEAIGDKDVTDWLNSDLDELIDFDYKKDGDGE